MKTSVFHDKQVSIHGSTIKFFFVMALLSSQLCYGQDYVYINPTDNCIGTITRYYGSGKPIHYMKTSDRSGKFLFDWDQSFQQYTWTYPLYGYDVTDFTVVGDTLFFCGNDPDSIGVYGWVIIGASTWQFSIYSLSSNNKYITDVHRIRVFYGYRFPTILLIGNYVDRDNQINTSAVVHIKDFTFCEVAHSTDDYFDDIVVLDNHVVTVARKGHDDPHPAPHYMRVLPKNNFSLHDTTLFPTLYMWKQREAYDRILAQYVGLNSFVTVYHNDTALFFNTYWVNNFGVLNIHRYHSMRVNVNEPVRDVAYNDLDSTLMVIHKADTAMIASVFKRHIMSYLYFTWSWSAYPDVRHFCTGCNTSLMSTSKMSPSNYMVSGVLQDKMVVWKTDTPCKHEMTFQLNPFDYPIRYQTDSLDVVDFIISGIQLYSVRSPTPFRSVCERGKSEPIENSDDN